MTNKLERLFETFGVPERIYPDEGPQFWSKFVEWCGSWGIKPEKSSQHHPQSNGHAEKAVGQMKAMLKKTGGKDLDRVMLEHRNTPGEPTSPALRN